MKFLLKPLFYALILTLGSAQAATYYVSTTGSDGANGTSLGTAWSTFAHAMAVMKAGDTLMVGNGTYHEQIIPAFSCSSGSMCKVLAINDGQATIDGDTNGDGIGDLNNGALLMMNSDYWDVEGLIFTHGGRDCASPSTAPCYQVGSVVDIKGNNNILRRISAYNANTNVNSDVIGITAGSGNLIEDCIAGGAGRKMISIWGADGTLAKHNIVRRCVSFWQEWNGAEFAIGNWPWGDSIEIYGASSNIFENVISYGVNVGPSPGITVFSEASATVTNNAVLGSMSVKSGMKWDGTPMTWTCPPPPNAGDSCTKFDQGYRSGLRLGNPSAGDVITGNLFQDVFSWGNGGYGFTVDIPAGNYNNLVRGTILNNGLVYGTAGLYGSQSQFTTWTNNYVAGTDTTGTGARLIYRYQSTFNGDIPVPTLTSTPLWPWPMESRIQTELAVYLSKYLSVNPAIQNFSITTAMQSIFNSVPAAINPLGSGTDTQAPTAPSGLTATPVTSNQVNLTWTASTDNVGVAGYRVYRNGVQLITVTSTSYSDTGVSPGTGYTYAVAAYDAAGNVSSQSTSAAATTPSLDTTPPTVSITAPTAGATVSGSISVTANAADNVGVVGVQFKLDGANLGSEDLVTPYSVSFVTTGSSNGTHALTATARDAAGNTTTSASVSVVVSNATSGALSISGISDNSSSYANSQIPKYSKYEVTFSVNNTVATNLQLPYDPSPPAGISPATYPLQKGISVDALFSSDNWQTSYSQPAFYYEIFDDQIKLSWDGQNQEWHYPTGSFVWKVRFSPTQTGNWQYKLVATDASGTTQSAPLPFTVTANSTGHGPIKVSQTDKRYFEFADGTLFNSTGVNLGANLASPALGNTPVYNQLAQNDINFARVWISMIYGSAWLEWLGGRNIYDGYLPRAGLEPFQNPATGLIQDTQVIMPNDTTGWYDACRFQFWDDPESIKPNTNYKLSIKYYGTNITGPRVAGSNSFGMVGKISTDWVPNCQEPGTGTVITSYGQNTNDWNVIQGVWNSGSNNFVPRIYLSVENATGGKAYLDSVSLREDLGNGQYGPEIIKENSMQYELYFPQEECFSMDKLVAVAEQNGVYLKLVLSDLNDMIYYKMNTDGSWVINGLQDNPLGFYGLGRTMNKTRWLQQAWWRYAQARWGYSSNIHSWELLNEGDPFSTTHYQTTDEFGKYMHCRVFGVSVGAGDAANCTYQHPNQHMTTTSFWYDYAGYVSSSGSGFWGNPKYPNSSYADAHAYVSTSEAPTAARQAMQYDSAYYHLWHSSAYAGWNSGLPVVRGEAGMDIYNMPATTIPGLSSDSTGQWYHDYVWSSVDSGALYEMYWWYTPDIYNAGVHDDRPYAVSVQNFLAGIPLNNGHYVDAAATASDPNLRVAGQKDLTNGNAHLWIQNSNHTWGNVVNAVAVSPVTGTVTVGGFTPNKAYTLQTWNTYTTASQVSSTTTVTTASNGSLTIPVTALSSDFAVKIISTTAGVTPPGSLTSVVQ